MLYIVILSYSCYPCFCVFWNFGWCSCW